MTITCDGIVLDSVRMQCGREAVVAVITCDPAGAACEVRNACSTCAGLGGDGVAGPLDRRGHGPRYGVAVAADREALRGLLADYPALAGEILAGAR